MHDDLRLQIFSDSPIPYAAAAALVGRIGVGGGDHAGVRGAVVSPRPVVGRHYVQNDRAQRVCEVESISADHVVVSFGVDDARELEIYSRLEFWRQFSGVFTDVSQPAGLDKRHVGTAIDPENT